MSQVYQKPIVSLPCAAEAIHEGYVYEADGSYRMTKVTTKGDTALAVAMSSSEDVQLGTSKTMTAGEEWMFALIGSKEIVNVAFAGSNTVTPFCLVYLDDSTDGMATVTGGSARPIGHAMVKKSTSTSSGDLLPVFLDQRIGATLA